MRMANTNTDNAKCYKGCGIRELLFIVLVHAKCYTHLGKQFGIFIKPNIILSYNTVIVLQIFTQMS